MSEIIEKNHKTVFVLDHTPYFSLPCESYFDFEFLKKNLSSKITKSLWSCSIEAVTEYCRIVWDLFVHEKLIRFIVSDIISRPMNTWETNQQNLPHITNAFGMVGIPARVTKPGVDCSVVHGLREAVECLCELTEKQQQQQRNKGSNYRLETNSCRIICITSARDDASIKRLEEIFLNCLVQQNIVAQTQKNSLPITHCHFVVLNIYPCNIVSEVTSHCPIDVSPIMTSEVHSIKATDVHGKLTFLILNHYNLASTTVTGIPMKEEQNANSSANYDVEIFHLSSTHNLMQYEDLPINKTRKYGTEYDTITVKWCTPRGSTSFDFQNCVAMNRITPVDVSSRPSSCLINFLLNGRSVMLEMPKKHGGKIITHHLSAHGGEIFIHSLAITKSIIDDPPPISESIGGRVPDYRVADFAAFIKRHQIGSMRTFDRNNLEKAKQQLERHTKYWPLTISSTIMYNVKHLIEPLVSLMVNDTLSETDVQQCKQVILNLLNMESKNEPLNVHGSLLRTKNQQKRDDHYRILWTELETFLKNNLNSDNHRSVYNCLQEVNRYSKSDEETAAVATVAAGNAPLMTIALVDPVTSTAAATAATKTTVIRATTDSPMSPPSAAAAASATAATTALSTATASSSSPATTSATNASQKSQPMNVLDIILAQRKPIKRPPFHGRAHGTNNFFKLYAYLNADDPNAQNSNAAENGMVVE